MRVFITGITGFVGSYVAREVRRQHPEVELYGLVWEAPDGEPTPSIVGPTQLLRGDVRDPASLRSAMEFSTPDVVFHLAAASSVAASWSNPEACFEVNAVGTLNLLEVVRDVVPNAVTVVASSAEIYGGAVDRSRPLTESAPYRPVSPYAASKAAQDLLSKTFGEAHDLSVIRLRLFNQTGPGRPSHFAASSFARQIAEIEVGKRPAEIKVGNLDARRDFVDVRDAARGYWLAAMLGAPGAAYNVCSGHAISISSLLDILLSLTESSVTVVTDPELTRPADLPLLVGDPTLFHEATSWLPEIPLGETLRDLLDWWRHRVRDGRS